MAPSLSVQSDGQRETSTSISTGVSTSEEVESVQTPLDYRIALLQACCAATAGFTAAPLINCSNKCSLPGLQPADALRLTAQEPFLGARWSSVRQFVSSIRGTVPVTLLGAAAKKNGGTVTRTDQVLAVVAGGTAETTIAGLLIEIPETRIQSGLSRFSMAAWKCFPFLLARNIGTTIGPTLVISENINKASEIANSGAPKRSETQVWTSALANTIFMSGVVAVVLSPFQGVAARVIQEQTISHAYQNMKTEFRWENRYMTLLRVATRAAYTGVTGCAITSAFLVGEKYIKGNALI